MSERLDFKGDYMGFSYGVAQPNGTDRLIHSSELGIVRTSNGSRFNENLLPTMQDKTVQVPGGDGTYYFGSYYTQRPFTVNFAFDSLTEEQLAELRRVFGDKGEHDLIFDETPYKAYRAKVTGTATLKYLPFAEGSDNRVYKGEGSIQFTCYYPFARCWNTNKGDYYNHPAYVHLTTESEKTERINEWWDASRIEQGGNFGDLPVSFIKEIEHNSGSGRIQFGNDYISWTNLPRDCILNTKTGLLIGDDDYIYNSYLSGNSLLKIPVNATSEQTSGLIFTCEYF